MWLEVDVEYFTEDELIVATADRIRADKYWTEDAVGCISRRLVGARPIKSPDTWLHSILDDTSLVSHKWGRLGAVDPDVFGLIAHVRNLPSAFNGDYPRE